jgi:isopenicillin N synthase-like dioxygenase
MGAQEKLQVQNHEDWIDAIAEPDELLINVGDMLSRYTNNKLKSTIHQVVTLQENWGTSLFSAVLCTLRHAIELFREL